MNPASEERPEAAETARLALRAGYGAAIFVASAGTLVMEITAGRLLAPYVGMSLYSWTAIIAVVLAGLSLGNWCGGYLSERPAERQASWIGGAFALAAASSLLSLVLLHQLSGPILGLGLGTVASVLAISFTAFFLPAFFPGLVGPPLTRRAIALAPGREGRASRAGRESSAWRRRCLREWRRGPRGSAGHWRCSVTTAKSAIAGCGPISRPSG